MSLTEYGLTAAGSMSATGSGRSSFAGLAYWSADLSNPLVPFDAVKVETAVGEVLDCPFSAGPAEVRQIDVADGQCLYILARFSGNFVSCKGKSHGVRMQLWAY